ncbi:MAG: glycosidase, partial [Candidatus Lokiarchaeota archaeon]|nr:glycosidase [Candidatus Lokiarchaeota archaeon]
EPRAITVFGTEASKAAAVITSTLPGARLIFEGQTRGYEIKLPVQLGRATTEEDNIALMEFYDNLLKIIPGRAFNNGKWSLCKVKPISSSDNSFNNIISYQWWTDKD